MFIFFCLYSYFAYFLLRRLLSEKEKRCCQHYACLEEGVGSAPGAGNSQKRGCFPLGCATPFLHFAAVVGNCDRCFLAAARCERAYYLRFVLSFLMWVVKGPLYRNLITFSIWQREASGREADEMR